MIQQFGIDIVEDESLRKISKILKLVKANANITKINPKIRKQFTL
jgi:hypothetical protein